MQEGRREMEAAGQRSLCAGAGNRVVCFGCVWKGQRVCGGSENNSVESVGFHKLKHRVSVCTASALPTKPERTFFLQSIIYICLAAVGAINQSY